MKRFFPGRVVSSRGYTIDQTILIVAIIAILITLVIITVGWNLLNRSTSTKLVAQLRQIENANGEFYVTYGEWPQNAYTEAQDEALSGLALSGGGVTYKPGVLARGGGKVKNMLIGTVVKNGAVRHAFSNTEYSPAVYDGPGIYLKEAANPTGMQNGRYLIVMLDDVMLKFAREADKVIDGDTDFSNGRLVAGIAQTNCHLGTPTNIPASAPDSQLVDVCYVANLLN